MRSSRSAKDLRTMDVSSLERTGVESGKASEGVPRYHAESEAKDPCHTAKS